MKKYRVLTLIPARYASSRFPGKPLALISKKSMIQRVYENCASAVSDDIEFISAVVTDDDRIEEHVNSFGGRVLRVDDDVQSGSERISLAYERYFEHEKVDLIVNVQGDEPLLKSDLLENIAHFHLEQDYDIATVVKRVKGLDGDFLDPNKVKAVFSPEIGKCHYFSRASIPFDRDKNNVDTHWFLHVGVYSYRPQKLKEFCSAGVSRLENLEKLEQLRALELGMSIGAIETNAMLLGVDTPEDIKRLEGVLGE